MPKRSKVFILAPLALAALPLCWFACSSTSATAPAETVAAAASSNTLQPGFQQTLQPFVQKYCLDCHSGEKAKAELDLSKYNSFAAIAKDANRWHQVLERVKAKEMPPDDADHLPTAAELKPVVAWLEGMHAAEVQRTAGDPGIVLARRLSNAEYDYTIRDLTRVDLKPTKEFPVDPANEAGFDNSGESLAMSPALVKKYIDAARMVADSVLFKPDGLDFAPFPVVTDEDRDKYAVHRIVAFYKQQGLPVGHRFDTYMAQFVDYSEYFQAAWRFQHRAELSRRSATLVDFAQEARLSPKYLGKIWEVVTMKGEEAGPIAAIQARWRRLPAPVSGRQPGKVAEACQEIHDFIIELRPFVTDYVANFPGRGIASGSQSLVLWKNQQYAAKRMTYPGTALEVDMDWYAKTDPLMLIPADAARVARYEESFKVFCAVFPDAFVVWERARMFLNRSTPNGMREINSDLSGHRLLTAGFHSQMGYFRDDAPLCELMLDEAQKRELDTLWAELDFVATVPARQIKQFIWFERGEPPSMMADPLFTAFRSEDDDMATEAKIKALAAAYLDKAEKRNVDPRALQAVRDYFVAINLSNRALEQAQRRAEPLHLRDLVAFAERASRRPLSQAEKDDVLGFYQKLRKQHLTHEDAIRDSIVSVLMSPKFTYRYALPAMALGNAKNNLPAGVQPLSDYELANRLSYFLWSSMPDHELLARAAAGDLRKPEVLLAQAKRMLRDDRIRGLATEFATNWLDVRRFEEHNAVDREYFPNFTNELRQAMFEEPIRFTADLIQRNGSVLDFVYGDYTLVNGLLAKHYGMPSPENPDEWVRVTDAKKYQRGGLLPMSVFLTKNAPGLRTSPVKRGHWVVTRILGQRIPAPPPDVPDLPADEKKLGARTLRQTLAKHREDKSCATCHNKFDSFGLVFEGFGPIGESRVNDLAGRPAETTAVFPDGSEGAGVTGLQHYIRTQAQDQFVDTLSRKLIAFALGRTLIPSDELVVAAIRQKLSRNSYRFDTLVEEIVTSRQFLNKRISLPTENNLAQ